VLDLESLFNLSYGMCIASSKKDGRFNGCIVNTVFQPALVLKTYRMTGPVRTVAQAKMSLSRLTIKFCHGKTMYLFCT
jgi:hypothetical protein